MNLHDFFTDVLLIIWRMRKQYTPGPLACIEAREYSIVGPITVVLFGVISKGTPRVYEEEYGTPLTI